MSVTASPRKAGPYACDGSDVTFTFAFKVFKAADVRVVHTDALGAETDLTLTTDYTVSLNPDQDTSPGGSITTVVAYPLGEIITLTSMVAEEQPVVITNAGGFYPRVINDALDRLTILVQQVMEQVGRAVKVNISSSTDPDALINDIFTSASTATSAASAASASASTAEGHADDAEASALAAAGYAAGVNLPPLSGVPDTTYKILQANAANNGYELHQPQSSATPSAIARRDVAGRLQVAAPVSSFDAVNKAYADALGVTAATANTIARRDANGRLKVAAPVDGDDAATRDFVISMTPGVIVGDSVTVEAITGTWGHTMNGTGSTGLDFDDPDIPIGYYFLDFTGTPLHGSAFDRKWYLLTPNFFGPFSYMVPNSAGVGGLNFIPPGVVGVGDSGTFTAYRLSFDTLKRANFIACNAGGTELLSYGAPNVIGSARSASALLAPFPITVTGLPSNAFAFRNNAGAAVKPTAYRVVVV